MPGHQLAVFYLAVLTISVSVNSSPQSFGTFRGPLPEKVPSNGQSARSTLRGSQSRHEGDPPQSSPDDHLGQPSAAVGGLQTQRPDGPLKQHSSNVFPVQPLTGGPGKHHSSDGSAIPHFTGGPPKHHSPNGLPKHDNPDAWPRHGHSPMDPEPTTPPSDEVKQAVPPNHHDDIPINININNGGSMDDPSHPWMEQFEETWADTFGSSWMGHFSDPDMKFHHNHILSITDHETPDCPEGFMGHNDKCFMLSNFEASRADAARYCRAFGGGLISLETPLDNYLVKYYIKRQNRTSHKFWTSGFHAKSNGWVWETTRQPITYTHFVAMAGDITADEKKRWEEVQPQQEKINEVGMLGWVPRLPFTGDETCIVLGSAGTGESLWRKSQCLGIKAYFICSPDQQEKREQETGLGKDMTSTDSGTIDKVEDQEDDRDDPEEETDDPGEEEKRATGLVLPDDMPLPPGTDTEDFQGMTGDLAAAMGVQRPVVTGNRDKPVPSAPRTSRIAIASNES